MYVHIYIYIYIYIHVCSRALRHVTSESFDGKARWSRPAGLEVLVCKEAGSVPCPPSFPSVSLDHSPRATACDLQHALPSRASFDKVGVFAPGPQLRHGSTGNSSGVA